VKKLGRESYIHFFYEATVGAGLPIMGTLKHLVETGDRVQRIEGIFSGALAGLLCVVYTLRIAQVTADRVWFGYIT
jgi:aspartokinase/homoserine dehydrogenase 1